MTAISRRAHILSSTALALGLLASSPAHAQTASSLTAIEGQIKSLQHELQELKRQMQAKEAAVKAARQDAQQAKESAAAAQAAAAARPPAPAAPAGTPLLTAVAPNLLNTIPGTSSGPSGFGAHEGNPDLSKGAVRIGGVTIQLGGFIAAESAFRTKNQGGGDLISTFSGIPFPQSPLGHESSTVLTGRQSRFSLLAFGDPTPNVRLSAYYEMDFFGGSTNGNNNESNSYAPRVRQAFASVDYDDRPDDIGLHILAGQTFSLVTPYYSGLLPRSDNTPRTIDPQYLVGFTWARQPQLRLTADFLDHRLWAGLSIEEPQTVFATGGYTAATATAGSNVGPLPVGGDYTLTNAGISPNNTANNYSFNSIPDFVGKLAADTNFGHYEAYGLIRVLSDRVDGVGKGYNNNSLGGGVGGSAAIHVFSGLDLVGDILAGDGIGRYGSGQLSDATIKPNGTVSPIPEIEALAGAITHPTPQIDVYGYLGTEQASKTAFTYAGKGYGYGSPLFVNTGCGTELSTATCTGNTQALYEGTLGGWYRPYKGSYGTLQTGLQYSHILREAFYGVGGKPQASEDVVFVSFRYYPFQ
jgi:hypothetical protein